MELPVIDYSVLADRDGASYSQALEQLHQALVDIGFVFIKNHGVGQEQIDAAFKTSDKFFDLDANKKRQCRRCDETVNSGYVCVGQEKLNPKLRASDLKECYNVTLGPTQVWPDVDFPFKNTITDLFWNCNRVAMKLLECMGHALQLEDPLYFVKAHRDIGDANKNFTTMRLLHYPPVSSVEGVLPGQLRCGEHVDYGSVTLLLQDSRGGLQVKCSTGEFIDVPHIPGAILINLGILMQKWTADQYMATPHRVLVPDDESTREKVRQSIAFFVHPANDVLIRCIDGSDKYLPITAKDDLEERFANTY